MLCTPIFVHSQIENQRSKVNLKYSLQPTFKLLYLFDILSQIGQGSKQILAIISTVTRSMQCYNKKIGQDFDRRQRSKCTAHASAIPLSLGSNFLVQMRLN